MNADDLHAARERAATLTGSELQNLEVLTKHYEAEQASAFFGSPAYFAWAALIIVLWIAVNTWGSLHHWRHVDDPPFFYLQGLVSANALMLTIAVLIRQSRMSALAEQRAHLDLQINLLTEQKVTRVLQVLLGSGSEEPKATDVAQGGEDLTKPTDPGALLQAIKEQDATP